MTDCPTWLPQDPYIPNNERERCAVKGNHVHHTAGLTQRYRVEKIHDPKGRHADCRYFVLDPQHDAFARVALRAYANAAERSYIDGGGYRRRGLRSLARDLRAWLRRIDHFEAQR